ncbi:hypothetical protein LSAT2_026359 [Lamellibrachia satsuma]|nr:hypothetical protein LSAT2_026359 [Lamellibrachia satsuma]
MTIPSDLPSLRTSPLSQSHIFTSRVQASIRTIASAYAAGGKSTYKIRHLKAVACRVGRVIRQRRNLRSALRNTLVSYVSSLVCRGVIGLAVIVREIAGTRTSTMQVIHDRQIPCPLYWLDALGYCHIPAESISELARGLHQLTALEDLNFSWNNFDVAAGAALGRSLSRLRGLEHLRLVGCHMNDNTAVHVAECVAYSPGLQTFDLQMNHISRPGVERVKEIIGGRGRLVELDYQEPPSDEDCGRLCDGGLWQADSSSAGTNTADSNKVGFNTASKNTADSNTALTKNADINTVRTSTADCNDACTKTSIMI